MGEQSLPPLFPEGSPTGEPVQPSHEQLISAAEAAAASIDFVDSVLNKAVSLGLMTEEAAAAHHAEFAETTRQQFIEMEAGRYVPDPDGLLKADIARSELALTSLDLFDRVCRAAVAAGELNEAEYSERRQALLDRINISPDGPEGQEA